GGRAGTQTKLSEYSGVYPKPRETALKQPAHLNDTLLYKKGSGSSGKNGTAKIFNHRRYRRPKTPSQ
ncbi:MAG: hypothetical protein MJE68_17290, partial [Proteobacteria bacterium]|nr:hypothetical protein [Pseudomonadota bacterium]